MNENSTSLTSRRSVLKTAGVGGFTIATFGRARSATGEESVRLLEVGIRHEVSVEDNGSQKPVRYHLDPFPQYEVQDGLLLVTAREIDNSWPIFTDDFAVVTQNTNSETFESIEGQVLPHEESRVVPTAVAGNLSPVNGIVITGGFTHASATLHPGPDGAVTAEYRGRQETVGPGRSVELRPEERNVNIDLHPDDPEAERGQSPTTTTPVLAVNNRGMLDIHVDS